MSAKDPPKGGPGDKGRARQAPDDGLGDLEEWPEELFDDDGADPWSVPPAQATPAAKPEPKPGKLSEWPDDTLGVGPIDVHAGSGFADADPFGVLGDETATDDARAVEKAPSHESSPEGDEPDVDDFADEGAEAVASSGEPDFDDVADPPEAVTAQPSREPAVPKKSPTTSRGEDSSSLPFDPTLASSGMPSRRRPSSVAAPREKAFPTGTSKAPGRAVGRSAPTSAREPAQASPVASRRGRRAVTVGMSGEQAKRLDAPTPPRRKRRWIRVVLVLLLLLVFSGAAAVVLGVRHFSEGLPSVAQLKRGYDPPQVTRILAKDGTLLASVFEERRTVVAFDAIPNTVKLAFLAAEDAYFYEHEGLNYLGMMRALVANLRAGHTVQGGSTITQQVVKNILLDATRSYTRKIRETLLATRLEQHLTKDEIFWLYLNHIYLGHGRYGIEEAARYYFGKGAARLRLDEAATLAGIVASPERYSPRKDPERALERRSYVLRQMLEKGFIQTRELHDEAGARALRVAPATEAESELSPEAVTAARKVLEIAIPDRAATGGFTIETTIEPRLQAAARKAVRENLDDYAKRHKLVAPFAKNEVALWGKPFSGSPRAHGIYVGVVESTDDHAGSIDVRVGDVVGRVMLSQEGRYNPTRLSPSEFCKPGAILRVSLLDKPEAGRKVPLRLELGPQSALVALDVRTRNVVAMVGSYEALSGGLNRAMQAKRQPGSAFKPFVYSWALHSRRVTPATMIELHKKGHGLSGEPPFRMSVRSALAHSNNEAAQWLLKHTGPADVVRWAQALGVQSPMKPDEALALGAYEMTPFEVVRAYAAIASGGEYVEPNIVSKIAGPDGSVVSLPMAPPKRRVMEADEAYLTVSLMESVVRDGTARRAQRLGRPVAGKTGTTNESRDAWFVGFSTQYVVGVWVGYDDSRPLGRSESGARTALGAWIDFMQAAHEGQPPTEFVRPASVVLARVDPASGLLPFPGQEDDVVEEFLAGTVPEAVAPIPGLEPEVPEASPEEPVGTAGAPTAPPAAAGASPVAPKAAAGAAPTSTGGSAGDAPPPPF